MMNPTQRRFICAAGALAIGVSLSASTHPSITFTDTRLKNGLRLIIAENHVAPVVSVAVVYNVGSRNERKGRTGVAHLLEHMMFKGSQNVGPGEHFYTIFSNGGTMNGTTSKERTLYYDTLPAHQLEAALFLEADRMRSLTIVRENVDNQRKAVQEERRRGIDNQPYGRTNEAMDDLAFDDPAYKHSVMGSMDDLNAASVDDVAVFFRTYYAPNNAIVAVTGDVSTVGVQALARKYFEPIRPQAPAPELDVVTPTQNAERRLSVDDALAALPRLDISYHIPSSPSPDAVWTEALVLIMSAGRSSRFYEGIVRKKQLATNVNALAPDSRGPRFLRIMATPAPTKTLEELEAAIYEEIEKIKTGPIADWELEKARNTARRQFVARVQSSVYRAIDLAEYALVYDNPGEINRRWQRFDNLRAVDVQRVATQYLIPENRSVIVTHPKPTAERGGR